MTRTPLSRSKGQFSRSPGRFTHRARAVLARQAAAAVAVGVRTCWPWETARTLPSARPCEALRRPRWRRGRGHIVAAARIQLAIVNLSPRAAISLMFDWAVAHNWAVYVVSLRYTYFTLYEYSSSIHRRLV